MKRPFNPQEKDYIWQLFHQLTTARQPLLGQRHLGMAIADMAAICCHLAQQSPAQAIAARKVLRTLFAAYEQTGIATGAALVLGNLESHAHEIAALTGAHKEIADAFTTGGPTHE